jgi:hypothetical protein
MGSKLVVRIAPVMMLMLAASQFVALPRVVAQDVALPTAIQQR